MNAETKPRHSDRESIEKAMAALEAQRETLGDEPVEAALDGLRRRLNRWRSPPPRTRRLVRYRPGDWANAAS